MLSVSAYILCMHNKTHFTATWPEEVKSLANDFLNSNCVTAMIGSSGMQAVKSVAQVCRSVSQCDAVCCSVLQFVAVCRHLIMCIVAAYHGNSS